MKSHVYLLYVRQVMTRYRKQCIAPSSQGVTARRWSTPDTIHTILLTSAQVLCHEWWTHCAHFVLLTALSKFTCSLRFYCHQHTLYISSVVSSGRFPLSSTYWSSVLMLLTTTANRWLSQETHTYTHASGGSVYGFRAESKVQEANTKHNAIATLKKDIES
jgi:hypothetical protein